MKITSQTTDEIVLKTEIFSVIMNFLFPLIFIVVGGVFVSASFQLHDTGYLQIAAVLIVFGLLYILFSVHRRVLLIDKQREQIIDVKKRFILSQSKVYNISDVQRVELRKKWYTIHNSKQQGFSGSDSRQSPCLSVFIVFKDNSDLLVDFFVEGPSSVTINGLGLPSFGKETQKAVDLTNNIANFFGVPCQGLSPENLI